MAKRIRSGDEIYLAPQILGYISEDRPIAKDEENNTELNPHDIDHKIIIYERQVNGWFLNPATELLERENCNFIAVIICLAILVSV